MAQIAWFVLLGCVVCTLLALGIVCGIKYYHKKHPLRYIDYDIPMLYGNDGVDEWEHCDRD